MPGSSQVALRPAAVLVLLTDSREGPAVLLTQRASDLTHYPDQLVFPGGAAEAGDDGPAATALREAAEETGLDPANLHILAVLPAVELPDTGFLLSPVLAWSALPTFTSSANLAEVSACTTMSLRQLARPDPWPPPPTSTEEAPMQPQLGALGGVTRMIIDLVTGMLARIQDPHTPATRVDESRTWRSADTIRSGREGVGRAGRSFRTFRGGGSK